ncbi:Uma2 family endonuclease [Thermostichus sp. MS-CIW-19]|jgi:Uma2 family endonuclease|uniref:Uma2 family endonuclease n=3 Tax=Synechococcus TaxID=1129 RepID=UPI0000694464|nr:Uma2 family endonuclease [Synechococcus sp. JA-3-3Ab]ABC99705.1 conserved hypothetical protein [Synechococcus sp. JA-3-3Ab]
MTVISLKTSTSPILERHDATWQDYVAIRSHPDLEWQKLSFHRGWLWVNMGKEGPEHASVSDLMTAIFFAWAFLHPDVPLQSYGRCLIEYPETHACAPDLVLYKGENIPKYQAGEPRRIDLRFQRPPDLVGEIADTTLALDLDEQKQLYASLGIPEYWVIDVKGRRVFAFALAKDRRYRAIAQSEVLAGLQIALLEQALERLASETNTAAANWLLQQLQRQA